MSKPNRKQDAFHPDLDHSLVPRQKQGYYVKKIPCCLILKDENGGNVLKLNETGILIWELCAEGITVGEILSMLCDQYPEHKDQIGRDVYRVLDTLQEYDVIDLMES